MLIRFERRSNRPIVVPYLDFPFRDDDCTTPINGHASLDPTISRIGPRAF